MKTIALLLLLRVAAFAADPFKLTILDSWSAPIRGALVFIRWDPTGSGDAIPDNIGIRQDLILKTDGSGVVIADLPAGFYNIFVAAPSFTPMCRVIRLGRTPARTLTLRMPTDTLIREELGTRRQQNQESQIILISDSYLLSSESFSRGFR